MLPSRRDWTEELLARALAVDGAVRYLSIVVERLGDLFEPRLCETYAELVSASDQRACPELKSRASGSPARPDPRRPKQPIEFMFCRASRWARTSRSPAFCSTRPNAVTRKPRSFS